MKDSVFSTKDIVKYLIVAGLVYTILKMIPSVQMNNKDLILVLAIITIGFVMIDCTMIKTKEETKEGFALAAQDTLALDTKIDIDSLIKRRMEMQAVKTQEEAPRPKEEAPRPKEEEPRNRYEAPRNRIEAPKYRPLIIPQTPDVVNKVGCAMEVDKVKKELENEINKLKSMVNNMASVNPDSKIAEKYFDSLLNELNERGVIDSRDIENILLKMKSKLLTIEEVISSLEMLKKEGRSRARTTDGKVKDDKVYNELPSDFYSPLGDKIANEWDNDYTILNTNKWQVPMPRPPVCVNTAPCKVCPTDSSNYPVNLKQWDDSRYVTQSKINKKWSDDQARA
jgi:hypothetical protein